MKHYAVIGSPIAHSRSPEIYMGLFEKYGVDADYSRIEVDIDDLPHFCEIVKELDGFAVTMPLKRAIIPFLDALDDFAKVCGAVNYVQKADGRLVGFNTDGAGLADAIERSGFFLRDKTALILGRGGAARAAAYELQRRGCSVTLLVRSRSSDADLQECVLPDLPRRSDVFINAAPLGMLGKPDFESFGFLDRIDPELVFDMVYIPGSKTGLVSAAQSRGIPAIDGNSMLLYQALRSFEIMTGIHAE